MTVLKMDVGKTKESAGDVRSSAAPVAAFFAAREGGN
jgi:hypothetical protein